MSRIRLAMLLLASLLLALPPGHAASAERKQPSFSRILSVLKKGVQPRPRRKTQKPKRTRTEPAVQARQSTPAAAPVPSPNPERAAPAETAPPPEPAKPAPGSVETPAAVPLPTPNPETEGAAAGGEAAPPNAPLPTPKPSDAPGVNGNGSKPGTDAADEPATAVEIPPRPATTDTEEQACRAQLKSLGAEFTDQPPQADPLGCALPHPLLLTKLSATITVKPGALVDCAIALAASRFAQGPMSEAARSAIGEDLVAIEQASAYVCRPRHGTRKLSEHAFGNAVDFSRFVFSKGTVLDVGPAPGDKGGKFLADVRKAACGPFKTVLGPGSDADHATHLHLDLAHRRNGGTFCQ